MDKNSEFRIRQILLALGLAVLVACAYGLISTFIAVRTTGILSVSASVSQALISISQPNHEAKIVGTGTAKVHLRPGLYQVRGYVGRDSAVETIKVTRNKVANVTLHLSETPRIRSVDDIDFNGLSSLTDNGLSDDQTAALKLAFFRFKTSTEVVTINGESFTPAPRNSATTIGFSATVNVSMDSTPYQAKITYSGLSNLNLSLYDPQTNSLVFNSDAGSPKEGD